MLQQKLRQKAAALALPLEAMLKSDVKRQYKAISR